MKPDNNNSPLVQYNPNDIANQTNQNTSNQQDPNQHLHQYNQYNYYQNSSPNKEKKSINIKSILSFPFKLIEFVARLLFFGCGVLIILVLLLFIFLLFRPAFAWEPLKVFLNEGIIQYESYPSLDELYNKVNPSDNEIEEVVLTEPEVAILFNQLAKEAKDVRVEINENKLRVMFNTEVSGTPFWIVVDFAEQSNGVVGMQNVGFVRFGFPGGVNSLISDQVLAFLNISDYKLSGSLSQNFIEEIFTHALFSTRKKIEDVRFEEDKLIISFNSTN